MTTRENKKNLTYGIILAVCALILLTISLGTAVDVVELTYILVPIAITIFMYSYAFIYAYININKLQDNETYEKDKNYVLEHKSKIISIAFKLQIAIFVIIWISFVIFLTFTVFELQSYLGFLVVIPFVFLLGYLIKLVYSNLLKNE